MKLSGYIKQIRSFAWLIWLLPLAATSTPVTGVHMVSEEKNHDYRSEGDTLPVILRHPMVAGSEWVFMITDRQTYIAGENIWFTVKTWNSGKREIPRSLAVYAEILNPAGIPVAQCRVLPDSSGAAGGLLSLPDSLSSGDYLIRSYTRAMTSIGPEYFHTRVIRVFNPYKPESSYTALFPELSPPGPAVELFPEGGPFIPGRHSMVVVRTFGPHRKGTPARVIIYSGEPGDGSGTHASGSGFRAAGDTIYTDRNGIGSCLILPGAWLWAEAIIDSVAVQTDIQSHTTASHALSVRQANGGGVRITVSHSATAGSGDWLNLAVINNQGLTFFRKFRAGGEEDHFELPAESPGTGISDCILYDNNGTILASRLFMNSGPDTMHSEAEKVTLTVTGNTLRATLPRKASHVTLSAAITGESQYEFPGNSILLGEWLKTGIMADPFMNPFLSGMDKITDELLITLHDRYLDIEPYNLNRVIAETRGIALDCSVTDLEGQKAAGGRKLFINLPGKECFLRYAVSNPDGRLTFIVPPRSGIREIVIYPEDTTKNIAIRTLTPYFTGSVAMHTWKRDITSMADETVLRMSLNSQVMRIYQISHTDTAEVKTDTTTTGRHFYGMPEQRLVISDYIALPEMEEFFFELISGFKLIRTRSGYEFKIYDPVTGNEIKTTPLMFIDGTRTTDPGTIALLSPYNTEYIDISTRTFRLGEVQLSPMVSVITGKGDFRGQKLPPMTMRFSYRFTDPVVYFRPFMGDPSGHMPRFANTVLWVSQPVHDGNQELLFTTPGYDYSKQITVSLSVFTHDGSRHFINTTVNPGELQ